MKRVGLAVLILLLYQFLWDPALLLRQTRAQSRTRTQQGGLSGHVVTDTGQPLANIRITITCVGDQGPTRSRVTSTDERGTFQFGGLAIGSYTLSVRAPGYIRADRSGPQYYRPGEYVGITMMKGGAITGTVKDSSGAALVSVPVRAFRIEDLDGKSAAVSPSIASRLTDDRGVYRLYGLGPGYYLVCAGGGSRSYTDFNKYQHQAPTYYPSSARQTAEKIMLRLGQEVSNIDIVHRGESGHVVSGITTGSEANQFTPPVAVALIGRPAGEIRDVGYTTQDRAFAFYGVPDGEYCLIAQYSPVDGKERSISRPYCFRVAQTDVADVKLTLSRLASVSGNVILQPLSKEPSQKCATREQFAVQAVVLSLRREKAKEQPPNLWDTAEVFGAPDENGYLSIRGITPDQYLIDVALPSESWFTKSVELVKDSRTIFGPGTSPGAVRSLVGPISVQSENSLQLLITVAEGAARVNGRVLLDKPRRSLPPLSIHLVPTDRIDSENPLRFFQGDVENGGAFSLKRIPPGKYFIFARLNARVSSEGSSSDPSSWTAEGRALLRKEAQRSGGTIELLPCQELQAQIVRYAHVP